MKIGLVVPQGWTGEYHGWSPDRAWTRTLEIAKQAEALGFESLWAFDHFTTTPKPIDSLTFESFTVLTALAGHTENVRLGHLVACAAFRNASLMSKMACTLDVISGGRFDLGLGAGWKEDEFVSYGYEFLATRQRLQGLAEALEVATRMLRDGSATYSGEQHRVSAAISNPNSPHMPILVGGNGPEVTWRLAARYADELNVDDFDPSDIERALPLIRQRCDEVDRDPQTLSLSVHYYWPKALIRGTQRSRTLSQYAELGVARVMVFLPDAVEDSWSVESLARDAVAAGVELAVN